MVRLSKAIRELNISLETAKEYLMEADLLSSKQHFDGSYKLTQQQYDCLQKKRYGSKYHDFLIYSNVSKKYWIIPSEQDDCIDYRSCKGLLFSQFYGTKMSEVKDFHFYLPALFNEIQKVECRIFENMSFTFTIEQLFICSIDLGEYLGTAYGVVSEQGILIPFSKYKITPIIETKYDRKHRELDYYALLNYPVYKEVTDPYDVCKGWFLLTDKKSKQVGLTYKSNIFFVPGLEEAKHHPNIDENILLVKVNAKWGLYSTGGEILKPRFDNLYPSEDYLMADDNIIFKFLNGKLNSDYIISAKLPEGCTIHRIQRDYYIILDKKEFIHIPLNIRDGKYFPLPTMMWGTINRFVVEYNVQFQDIVTFLNSVGYNICVSDINNSISFEQFLILIKHFSNDETNKIRRRLIEIANVDFDKIT